MTLPGDVPYMGDGVGGQARGDGGGGGKTYPMKTAARGAFELRRSLSRSPHSARCTSLPPPGRRALWRARLFSRYPTSPQQVGGRQERRG